MVQIASEHYLFAFFVLTAVFFTYSFIVVKQGRILSFRSSESNFSQFQGLIKSFVLGPLRISSHIDKGIVLVLTMSFVILFLELMFFKSSLGHQRYLLNVQLLVTLLILNFYRIFSFENKKSWLATNLLKTHQLRMIREVILCSLLVFLSYMSPEAVPYSSMMSSLVLAFYLLFYSLFDVYLVFIKNKQTAIGPLIILKTILLAVLSVNQLFQFSPIDQLLQEYFREFSLLGVKGFVTIVILLVFNFLFGQKKYFGEHLVNERIGLKIPVIIFVFLNILGLVYR